ncbi:growth-regulated alpha protein-like [Platichthys flesus]|uniref:growth-regulated alpha protein-like n=1 Tax=Platichthys flesus TaxID=8260 RepID=UPI002DB69353|nr:growth-regulated alpha protein-like [Platichthys flesus]
MTVLREAQLSATDEHCKDQIVISDSSFRADMSFFTTVALLVILAIAVGTTQGYPGVTLRCQCIKKERKAIGRHIERVEVIPASSHCSETEIIATLKNNGRKVCLDPKVIRVQRVRQELLRHTA